jgi:hypothetical protein
MMDESDLKRAHKLSIFNRPQIESSTICGCFYCLEIFPSSSIEEWVDEEENTPLCPKCGIDSVLGDKSGYPITPAFLQDMKVRWFGP